ncbi:MAG: multifunctional transcriptional regulator/nicotinamide-nucleotide adenylyltransferase/ribosylnicotinamide kinase NadR [Clostridiaceae bacterium]
MQYKNGMFGGSFDPLHIGHINGIIQAASMCQKLYIVLSYSRIRDNIPMEQRYRWLHNSLKHMSNVEIILLEDTASSMEEYDSKSCWESGRDYVLDKIGCAVDVVFCGSDYKGSNRYEDLYDCKVIYFDRNVIPISSTEIRKSPFKYWDYIPKICRPYYTKKVLFIGGESTGKSTLVRNLALAYNTNYLEEVGRDICDYAGSEDLMIAEDFHEILLKHKVRELDLIKESNRLFFVDTDALITKWFSCFLLKDDKGKSSVELLAEAITEINSFNLIIFLEPTVPFVQDGTRNEKIAADRKKYSEEIKELFNSHNLSYHCISGDYLERFIKTKELINTTFNLKEW